MARLRWRTLPHAAPSSRRKPGIGVEVQPGVGVVRSDDYDLFACVAADRRRRLRVQANQFEIGTLNHGSRAGGRDSSYALGDTRLPVDLRFRDSPPLVVEAGRG
jgi:hypothetical protein